MPSVLEKLGDCHRCLMSSELFFYNPPVASDFCKFALRQGFDVEIYAYIQPILISCVNAYKQNVFQHGFKGNIDQFIAAHHPEFFLRFAKIHRTLQDTSDHLKVNFELQPKLRGRPYFEKFISFLDLKMPQNFIDAGYVNESGSFSTFLKLLDAPLKNEICDDRCTDSEHIFQFVATPRLRKYLSELICANYADFLFGSNPELNLELLNGLDANALNHAQL